MTNEEVLQAFKTIYDSMKVEGFEDTIDEMIVEWRTYKEKVDKYRWHDLRKNPKDLPKHMDQVQICWIGGSNNWYDSFFWDWERKVFSVDSNTDREIIHPIINDKRYARFGEVVAWREIEPFEEA